MGVVVGVYGAVFGWWEVCAGGVQQIELEDPSLQCTWFIDLTMRESMEVGGGVLSLPGRTETTLAMVKREHLILLL
jgi:hypothetical protein